MSGDNRKVEPFWKKESVLKEEEMFSGLSPARGSILFLGRYTLKEVMAALAKKNFFREAKKKDLWPIKYQLDSSEYPVQRFLIYWKKEDPDRVIVDLKMREAEVKFAAPEKHGYKLWPQRCLLFEWLTLQNPRQSFDEHHRPLPGQSKPGLNLSKKILETFSYLARLIEIDALVAFPAYFHNALLFSRYFQFIEPIKQGQIKAIRKQFNHLPFRQLAWAVYLGCLKDEEGQVYEWQAEEQVYPFNDQLKEYLESKIYKEIARHVEKTIRFELDRELLEKKSHDQGILY
ncbi:MAG: hypothetical protein PHQ25_03070 [Acidobacteriota bacterium]|nr:hypothetical protein [Acidobacteriota bacterium]MDW3228914.1 hypothetical protein [Acidobacteriota bacterium]MDY0231766.1 hypothetical protein [Candidatus Saccharicenans sp.]